MTSEDFKKITDYIYNQKYEVQEISIHIDNEPETKKQSVTTKISLKNKKESIEFNSSEYDVSELGFALKKSIDKDGDFKFTKYKDLNKYYEDIHFLIDTDRKKIHKSLKEVSEGKKIGKEQEKLFNEFILSDRRGNSRFLPLKQNYYDIHAYFILIAKTFDKMKNDLIKKNPEFKYIFEKIFDLAFNTFKTGNEFKDYLNYKRIITFDIYEIFESFSSQVEYVNDLMGMLSTRGGVNGEIGIMYLLDIYRRFGESSFQFINFIRYIIERINGVNPPEDFKSYLECIETIKGFDGKLIKSVDPWTRHGESHNSIKVLKDEGKIKIYNSKNKENKLVKEYTFQEVVDMTKNIKDTYFPAYLLAFYLYELNLMLLIFESREFKISLLKIDN